MLEGGIRLSGITKFYKILLQFLEIPTIFFFFYNNGPRDAAPSRNVRSKSVKTTEKPRETRARENSNLILPAGYDGPAGS